MGYTHYWYRARSLDPAAFARAVEDCRKVCAALPVPLGNSAGEGEPEFGPDLIGLNGHRESGSLMPQVARVNGLLWPTRKAEGVAGWSTTAEPTAGAWCAGPNVTTRTLPESRDGSYESFIVERQIEAARGTYAGGLCFDFCKTNFRPYDLCVQCCLIALAEHLGDAFKVHSDGDSEAWNEARDVCQHVLGYGLLFELAGRLEADPEPVKMPEPVPNVAGLVEGTDLTTAAKNMRAELRAAFPRVKFAVRSKRFAGGDSINVSWTDGPPSAQVDAIVDKYADGDFDGMTDSYNYRRSER